MLIDTHSHINIMIKDSFETRVTSEELERVPAIVHDAKHHNVSSIINVGTSLIESMNSITLARTYDMIYASVGIHPNDATSEWRKDFDELKVLCAHAKQNKIVAIGECGIDFHYEGYDAQRQYDAFRAQIELALEHNLPLIIHSRDAHDETLRCLDEYRKDKLSGTMHCYSGDLALAFDVIERGFLLGIGGTVTYPKNEMLRTVVKTVGLVSLILETDAPYLPPQSMRGKKNSPANVCVIARYIAELIDVTFEKVALITTGNATTLFALNDYPRTSQ